MHMKYNRILLKLSGESLMGKQSYGIDADMLSKYANDIKAIIKQGVEVAVVIGGGNIYRGIQSEGAGFDRVQGDHMGMLATIINGLALQSALESIDVETRLLTAIKMEQVAEPYIRRKAMRHLQKGRVVLFGGGTGNPYFTTDTAATLRAIEIEANIETGKGYVSAEVAEDENKVIGEIKLDAMFSPVIRASYKVENSRVGQVTDYDKLIFEVETNGVITPDDAIALASRILQDQLQPFINFDEPEIQQDQSAAEKLSFNSNLLKKVEELELSVRSANCLKNDNIIYIGDLVQKSESEMLRTPNFGRKSLNEIKEVLQQMELNLGMSVPDWPPENIDDLAKKYEDPFNK